jgi:hypothetical protein
MSLVRSVALAVLVGVLAGCASKPAAEALPAVTLLQDVDGLLRAAGGGQRTPGRLAELERHQAVFPRGYAAVKSGEVVVLWGTPLKGEGDSGKEEVVVAYQKNVPSEGGCVLLSAGTVKKMSPAQFNAAPKAK